MRTQIQHKQYALPRRKFRKPLLLIVSITFCVITIWIVFSFRMLGNNPQKPKNSILQGLPSLNSFTKTERSSTAQRKPVSPASNADDFSAENLWSKSLSTEAAVVLGPRIRSNHTLVTAYFRAKSKYPSAKYDEWMQNMMSMNDPLVIFTQPDLVETMSKLRSDPSLSTVIVSCTLEDLPISKLQSNRRFDPMENSISFWEHQLEIDPEKRIHASYSVFWIWLSKSWLVEQAIQLDYFQSEFFVYTDIGCFRNTKYNHKMLVSPEFWSSSIRPDHRTLLWMAHRRPNPPPTYIWTKKLKQKQYFFQSGSQGAGYREAWIEFNREFARTLDDYVAAGVFIGEDQCILQATCLRKPELCQYIPFDQVPDNHYFGLRHILHFPTHGEYKPWRPPTPSADFLKSSESARRLHEY